MVCLLSTTKPRPHRFTRRFATALVFLGGLFAAQLHAGPPANHANDPAITLPLEKYGYQPLPARYLTSGATMFTLHFVDETHLLFTFHTRGLMPRLPDAAPEDNDRRITAVLIELPSGKELARTVWRTRDQDQYLWPLARGRFLLRIRSKLSLIEPVRHLADGNAFAEQNFLDFKRRIGYIATSPGGELLTVETLPPRAQRPDSSTMMDAADSPGNDDPDSSTKSAVEVHIYRVVTANEPGKPEHTSASVAGTLLTRTLIHVPATAEGFIDTTQDGSNGYLFDFQPHAGKRIELAGYETTCPPRSYFISRSEFLAFGCQVGDKVILSEFDLRGQQPWVQVLNGQHIAPLIVAAPDAGRFVLSRLLVSATYMEVLSLTPDQITSQELTVFQNHDGRILLKTQASPIQRAGQNFDLAPDGLSFATTQAVQSVQEGETVQNTRILVFHLAPQTAEDRKEIKLAADSAPKPNGGAVRLFASPMTQQHAEAAVTIRTNTRIETPTAIVAAPAAATQDVADPANPDAPRKPPSLYDADHPKPPPHQF